MNIFIWQWGRFGAGPRYAYELAQGLRNHIDGTVFLSLSRQSEIYQGLPDRSAVDLPINTFSNNGKLEIIKRSMGLPLILKKVGNFAHSTRLDVAICAMPGFWDLNVTRRLVKLGVPVITIVHDARSHPGDWFKPLYWLQERQILKSDGIITLTDFIGDDLKARGLLEDKAHHTIAHIPFLFPDLNSPAPSSPGFPSRQPLRLLLAGRLQTYKGIGLFAKALQNLGDCPVQARVVGTGRDPEIDKLARMNNVDLRNAWCSEAELIEHIDWADVIVAPYIEASQSGIISLALDRGRPVIATPVGGLSEQVVNEKTGLITDSVTSKAVTKAICHFIDDPELFTHCARNVRKTARQINDWKQIAPQFADLTQRVLRNR